jgi:hypothetical protein
MAGMAADERFAAVCMEFLLGESVRVTAATALQRSQMRKSFAVVEAPWRSNRLPTKAAPGIVEKAVEYR